MPTSTSNMRALTGFSTLCLTIIAGLCAPVAQAATANGTVELSPTPVNQTQAVPPNIVVTFDDSGSMAFEYMGDVRPFDNKSWSGPWSCAGVIDPTVTDATDLRSHVMNGVYYNPNVTYSPPINADGTAFPSADSTLKAVVDDGVSANRPSNPISSSTTNFLGTKGKKTDSRWECWNDSSSPLDSNGGPYYYRLKSGVDIGTAAAPKLGNLYNASNWTAVVVTSDQYQNWANWWAYYHTRNLMARTSISRVFGAGNLASTTSSGGFGTTIRVAWQNINKSSYLLPAKTIISSLLDTTPQACKTSQPTLGSQAQQSGTVTTQPACYRSDFFNWIFQVPASGGTPTRSATNRAGAFFARSGSLDPNKTPKGDLHDPYWQPPATGTTGDGNELTCRQNFHMLITDGLWNGDGDGPKTAALTQPSSSLTLPDGVVFPSPGSAGVTSIYSPVHDSGDAGYASLSDVAFHYWATNLRPDLYSPTDGKYVSPYLPDLGTSVFKVGTTTGSTVTATNVNSEIYFNPKNDPATWPHMAEYMIGLGVSGTLNFSENTDCTDASAAGGDACKLRKGTLAWTNPNGKGSGIAENIDDTWHAALAGRGQFFSAGNPQDLVDQLSNVLTNIQARAAQPALSTVNASVLTTGALSYNTGYDSTDWSGVLQAVSLNENGTQGSTIWDAGARLTNETSPAGRNILTGKMDATGKVSGIAFRPIAAFDAAEQAGLKAPAATDTTNDTLANRVDYIRGVRTQETSGVMRSRRSLLGAIIGSQALYVSYPSGGYTGSWPAGSPEAASTAQTYDQFVSANQDRPGTLYVGANDGMLHAFDSSLQCNTKDADGNCTSYGPQQNASAGLERWAYVPRAVYGNLGNLTSKSQFKFAPTVDGTPVSRDVFFGGTWHTILVGGLQLGGRGVYALDITDPTAVTESSAASSVLWEFDADAPVVSGIGNPADLGYTYGQPNIGRLANGKWVVLVPTGYYPDCSAADKPANCQTLAAASNGYSALFVLDAQTGAMLAELKTPTNITGVASHGLSSPVLGDYNNDQIDDVAFAGDLDGNLWRFDLSSSSPSNWKVTLAYKGIADASGKQGVQPITVMPRLFPDPATNRFIVLFGTGKYLGAGDNTSDSAPVQSVYGIRDMLDASGNPLTITNGTLQAQTLSETVVTDPNDDNYGATLRKLTANSVASSKGGWKIDLKTTDSSGNVTDAGERVVVTAGAVFSTNSAVISTVIPGSNDPCNPTVLGAAMFIDASTGGPGTGLSSLGGSPYVGARVNNVRTNGSLPVTTTVGGGKAVLPGITLTGKKKNNDQPLSGDAPIWRRRSWTEVNNGQ